MKKIGDKVYWMGDCNMAYGMVIKVTLKLYKITGSSNHRSQIYHDEILTKEEACKRHMQNAAAKFRWAKEWLEHSEEFTQKLLREVD